MSERNWMEVFLRSTEKSKYRITRFEKWMLQRIVRRIVTQSSWHEANIVYYYWVMEKAAMGQFNEANDPTLESFLDECQNKARSVKRGFNY